MARHALLAIALALAGAMGVTSHASAGDVLVMSAHGSRPETVSATSNPLYLWADGSYQSIRLPRYDLGWRYATFATGTDIGPAITHDPRPAGFGVAGGLGYVLPHGTLPAMFGTNARIELGGSYVHASGTQSAASGAFATASNVGFRLNSVDGALLTGFSCNAPCYAQQKLTTSYDAWQLNMKAASDVRMGWLTLTPSVAAIGGQARGRHDQSVQMVFSPPTDQYRYSAHTALAWSDWGAKLGLDATFGVTSWLALGLGGNVGLVHRDVSLAAHDEIIYIPGAIYRGATTSDATATPLLANAEARLTLMPGPNTAIRAFGGLNHDSRVPGVAPPCPHISCLNAAFVGPPAGIRFSAETSYYAGGGVTVTFRP